MTKRAMVLLSGGLDSSMVLVQALRDGCEVAALTVFYGQPAPNSQTVVTQSDWDQLNQLIGYSVSGCPLSRKASRRAARKADAYMAAHPKDPALCGEVVRDG